MASTSTARTQHSAEPSQYQHFIPRLILNNFSYKSSRNGGNRRGNRNGSNQRVDKLLHTIDLSGPKAKIVTTTVARTLGKVDMYRDFAKAENQQALEKQLDHLLESPAGSVIANIRKRFEAGDKEVWITRLERDTLRKFLFIMKYRSSNMHKRFYHESSEDYADDDRERLLEYMREKGFEKPIDVWFGNIKAILELEMDPSGEWMEKIRKRAYPDDAEWFIHHTQGMYMALCTPSEGGDEFLLTENGYGIHEGPVSGQIDPSSGGFTATSYTEYHVFAAISPRLMIVLRSFLLPNPTEDHIQDVREFRQTMYRLTTNTHNDPNKANSILADLPILKARNSYTEFKDGKLVLRNGEDGTHRANHRFCFRFFPIAKDHVDKINGIMLEESYVISTIVFGSRAGARKIIESYLSAPVRGESGFKIVSSRPDDRRLIFLRKLEHVVHQMGSNVVAVYHTRNITPTKQEEVDELIARMMELNPPPGEKSEHMQLYMRLGGSYATVMKDLEQARNMLNMRIKFDVWSQGLNEDFREDIRENIRRIFSQLPVRRVWYYRNMLNMRIKFDVWSQGLNEDFREDIRENIRRIFSQLPVRRVWYYLKHVRNMVLRDRSIEGSVIADGPEDVVAKVSQVIRSKDVARLMFAVVLNQISLANHAGFEIYPEIVSRDLLRSIYRSKEIIFSSAGSICDCGINEVEKKARLLRDKLQSLSYARTFVDLFLPEDAMILHPFWSDEQHTEMHTRFHTRIVFPSLITTLEDEEKVKLEEVLFDIAYPSVAYLSVSKYTILGCIGMETNAVMWGTIGSKDGVSSHRPAVVWLKDEVEVGGQV
ncbi:hypothetical protein V498_00358 [Pseudogymnoascus sp. VKM F-4517 (FW-2822)]|nr:hypothetical protein V498_00358 [Pseudogymnoascus sp. VKM F-4517 (FW-2822)]